jgi:hypothetical protein
VQETKIKLFLRIILPINHKALTLKERKTLSPRLRSAEDMTRGLDSLLGLWYNTRNSNIALPIHLLGSTGFDVVIPGSAAYCYDKVETRSISSIVWLPSYGGAWARIRTQIATLICK